MSRDPLPSLDRAFQLVSQEEWVRLSQTDTVIQSIDVLTKLADVLYFAVRAGAHRDLSSRLLDKLVCNKCHKPGHDAAAYCSDTICGHCKKKSHPQTRCYEIVGCPESRKSSSVPGSASSPSIHANAAVSSTSSPLASASSVSPLFTPEQWKAIYGLFGNAHILANRLNGTFDAFS